jgi:hypothetical protein
MRKVLLAILPVLVLAGCQDERIDVVKGGSPDAGGPQATVLRIVGRDTTVGRTVDAAVHYEAGAVGSRATSLTFDLEADPGLSLLGASPGESGIAAGKAASARARADGALRVILIGTDAQEIADGEAARVRFSAAAPGVYDIRFRDARVSDETGRSVPLEFVEGAVEVKP